MKILVIGETCKDIHVYCKCERLCPEAPVPVLVPIETIEGRGMAQNTWMNIVSLSETFHQGKIHRICSDSKSTKTRYIDKTSGYIIVRIDEHDIHPRIKKLNNILSIYKDFDAIVISDYNKGYLLEEDIEKISKFANKYNIITYLDSKKILGEWSKNIDFVKINRKEYENLVSKLDKPEKYCRNLIVTMGENGSSCINKNIHIPSEKVNVFDVSGAGDSYLAGFVIKYLETKDIKTSMIYANRVAGIAVGKKGVVAVNREEVK